MTTSPNTTRLRSAGPALAVLLVALAVFGNEWVIAFLFSRDNALAARSRIVIRAAQFVLAAAALGTYFGREAIGRGFGVARRYPRTFSCAIGISIAVALVSLVEAGFYSYGVVRGRASGVRSEPPTFVAGQTAHARLEAGDKVIYDVRYTIDDQFRRRTVPSAPETEDDVLFFFGCSFTFGEGVEDDETIPSVVAGRMPDWRVMNCGFPGLGTQHLLHQLTNTSTLQDLAGKHIKLVYIFIPGHVRRTIGSMRVASGWGRTFPCYRLDDSGAPVFKGTFREAWPLRMPLYRLLAREQVASAFHVDVPLRVAPRHLELTATLIAAARDRFTEFGRAEDFYVVLYPAHPLDEFSSRDLVPYLERAHVHVLDYADLLSDADGPLWLEHDLHPTALAHRLVGERLTADLALE